MDPTLVAVRHRLLLEHEGAGKWRSHEGDATAWAPAFLLAAPDATPEERAAAVATVARARSILPRAALGGPEREEAALGVLALIGASRGRAVDRAAAQAAIATGNAAAAARGGFLDRPASAFDPTTVTAGLAYGNLLLASALRGPARILHGRTAAWLLSRLGARVFDERHGYFATRPDERRVAAMPNLLAIAALARASKLRRDRKLLDRAERVEEALRAALYDGDAGAWHTGEEASSVYRLSIQNFAGLAYAELHAASPRDGWDKRARESLKFATGKALVKDLFAHDWSPESGPSARHCTGCNWQTLYVAQLIERGR